jgi:hypothetical protein
MIHRRYWTAVGCAGLLFWALCFWGIVLAWTSALIDWPRGTERFMTLPSAVLKEASVFPETTILLQIQICLFLLYLRPRLGGSVRFDVFVAGVGAICLIGAWKRCCAPSNPYVDMEQVWFFLQLWFGLLCVWLRGTLRLAFDVWFALNVVGVVMLSSLISCCQNTSGRFFGLNRWTGIFGNPNILGYCAVVAVFVAYFGLRGSARNSSYPRRIGLQAAWSALLMGSVLCLVHTFSRSAWLGALAAAAFLGWDHARARPLAKESTAFGPPTRRGGFRARFGRLVEVPGPAIWPGLAVAIAGGVLIGVSPVASIALPRLVSAFDFSEHSISVRLVAWGDGLTMAARGPVFGWGWRSGLMDAFSNNFSSAGQSEYGAFTLNDYMGFFITFGPLAGVWYCAILVYGLFRGGKDFSGQPFRVLLISMAVCSFSNSVVFGMPLGFVWWYCLINQLAGGGGRAPPLVAARAPRGAT